MYNFFNIIISMLTYIFDFIVLEGLGEIFFLHAHICLFQIYKTIILLLNNITIHFKI